MSADLDRDVDLGALRAAIAEISRAMYARGYIVAGDGNVSVRVGPDRVLVTATGMRKGFLKAADVLLVDLAGQPVAGEVGRPSSEYAMHRMVYQVRSDARAVVHAHPPLTVAHTVAGISMAGPLMPEAYVGLGEVVTVGYVTPGTQAFADALREPLRTHHALLMERHGSLTHGRSLEEAFDRLEILEHSARISYYARTLVPGAWVAPLDAEARAALDRLGS